MNPEFVDHIEGANDSLVWLQENLLALMDSVVRMRVHYMRHHSSLTEEFWHKLDDEAQDQLDSILLAITRLSDRVVMAHGQMESARIAAIVPLQQAQQRIKEELERRRKKDNK
jgi:hypothetical protein